MANAIHATIPFVQKLLQNNLRSISSRQSALSERVALSARMTTMRFLSGIFDKSFGRACGTIIYTSSPKIGQAQNGFSFPPKKPHRANGLRPVLSIKNAISPSFVSIERVVIDMKTKKGTK